MKITVCIRQGQDGEINPFDACAYEEALKIHNAEITLLSMGVPATKDFLLKLTRLGAANAVLLTDPAFAGADTLATAYTLSLAIRRLEPDLVFCGRQTLIGDTAQTAPMLAEMIDYHLITNAMSVACAQGRICCETRDEGTVCADLPALVTVERINTLRLPSIFSKIGTVETLTAADLGADLSRCGLAGSPTRVLESRENQSGKRKCTFIELHELPGIIRQSAAKAATRSDFVSGSSAKLKRIFTVGTAPLGFAQTISEDITVIDPASKEEIAAVIRQEKPNAVLWGSDSKSKRTAAQVAAMLGLGLCADCTSLETDGDTLFMVRPALSGSVIAKIKSLTRPAMATVRTTQSGFKDITVCVGYGAKEYVDQVTAFAGRLGADLAATRKAVDCDLMPYACQVGLTGKTVAPPVYIAVGVSGAIHHLVGMQKAGTVIAVNSDKNAPIFDYADFGLVLSDLSKLL